MQRKLANEFTQFPDRIVDWLPDDRKHVLVQMPSKNGSGVSRINIYSGRSKPVTRAKGNIRAWMTDGRGTTRLRKRYTERDLDWQYRPSGENGWRDLHKSKLEDRSGEFEPIGFGDDPNSLFVKKPAEVLKKGSPLVRVKEIHAPVLLFHGEDDFNVTIDHSRKLAKALKRANKPVVYFEYEDAAHNIRRNRYRVDILTRIGAFLDEHTRAPDKPRRISGPSAAD